MSDSPLLAITDDNLARVLEPPIGVLILSRSDCGPCGEFERELTELHDNGRLPAVPIGKLVLDQPGSGRFKRDNPWIAGLKFLPHTVIYRAGEQVDAFDASKGTSLVERLEDVSPA